MAPRKKRKHHSSEFKAKVALEAVNGPLTTLQIVKKFSVHRNQISKWKNHLLKTAYSLYERRSTVKKPEPIEQLVGHLSQKLKQKDIELNWLRTKITPDVKEKKELVESNYKQISIKRQCRLLGLNPTTYFYQNGK